MFQRQTTLDRRRRPDPVQAVRPCVLSTAWFPDIWPSSVNLSPTTMVIGQLVTGNCDLLPVGLRSSSHTGDIRRTLNKKLSYRRETARQLCMST